MGDLNSDKEILIAEDSPTQSMKLRYILEKNGYSITDVQNGKEALDYLKMNTDKLPTIIISDVNMPVMDGYEFCRQLKSDEHTKGIPVILLTMLSEPEDVFKGLNSGADNFIMKPYSEQLLISRIQYILANRELRKTEGGQMGIQIYFNGQTHFLTSERIQIIDLLLSTFEAAVQKNKELEQKNKELRIAEEELSQQAETLVRTNAELDQFLSHVSHELRTPLTAMYQFVTILLDGLAGDISPEQREYLEIVLKNAKQLQKMISDLLDITSAQSGKLSVLPQRAGIAEVISETISTFRTIAKEKDIELSAHIPDNLPPVYADPVRIKQILTNLIDNGIKFTPGKGTVSITASVFNKDPHYLCVEVKDTGTGISSEGVEKIFERLHQESQTVETSRKGLGLGLYICKELVARHGGQIWIESRSGHGSAFFFTLLVFSMENLVAPILTSENLSKGYVTIIAVEVCKLEKRQLKSSDEQIFHMVSNILERSITAVTDVVLPRMHRISSGEIFFIVAIADQKGAEVMVERIKKQMKNYKEINNAGFEPAYSFKVLNISDRGAGEAAGQSIGDVASRIEDIVEETVKERRCCYE